MTKQQILNVLYPVRQAYREAIEDIQAFYSDDPYDYLFGRDMEEGICHFIFHNTQLFHTERDLLIKELMKDKFSDVWGNGYWYPSPENFAGFPGKIIPKCLQPRLDHLNRTIARLENEINEYT